MNPIAARAVEACSYHQIDGGIHHYTFNEATRQAVDEHFEHFEGLVKTAPRDQTLPILLDLRPAGFPSLTYAFQKVRDIEKRNPGHAPLRFVFMHQPGVLTSIAQSLFNLLRVRDVARFFSADQYDEAIAWLRRED